MLLDGGGGVTALEAMLLASDSDAASNKGGADGEDAESPIEAAVAVALRALASVLDAELPLSVEVTVWEALLEAAGPTLQAALEAEGLAPGEATERVQGAQAVLRGRSPALRRSVLRMLRCRRHDGAAHPTAAGEACWAVLGCVPGEQQPPRERLAALGAAAAGLDLAAAVAGAGGVAEDSGGGSR